jgi:hypothetical protein
LQLASSRRSSNSSSNGAGRSRRWALLHVAGEGWKIASTANFKTQKAATSPLFLKKKYSEFSRLIHLLYPHSE